MRDELKKFTARYLGVYGIIPFSIIKYIKDNGLYRKKDSPDLDSLSNNSYSSTTSSMGGNQNSILLNDKKRIGILGTLIYN
jgi:hypothetical protein